MKNVTISHENNYFDNVETSGKISEQFDLCGRYRQNL